jgi:hypothetical protein
MVRNTAAPASVLLAHTTFCLTVSADSAPAIVKMGCPSCSTVCCGQCVPSRPSRTLAKISAET